VLKLVAIGERVSDLEGVNFGLKPLTELLLLKTLLAIPYVYVSVCVRIVRERKPIENTPLG
jgi:hypothetical protein